MGYVLLIGQAFSGLKPEMDGIKCTIGKKNRLPEKGL